ncbi:SusC/RagA family TonB-linked outer membrane protein [Adhaeribacter pallidiroseus]|uniref:TonB-dependent receptor SusC n=1 Tax=Adhaeribacter pallidiroseus TaxID=2072847 RepID=A0A369QJM2_9BACT|nr:TonB-dependent receptor [Adhaeribacter pallidiroseus]RDC65133.1 TonB-dependent receptor SusC [Adhaeribacter pallidiroseus]
MKTVTHRWQRNSCLLLLLAALGSPSYSNPLLKPTYSYTKTIDWQITGKVTDAAGGAVPGATVVLKGSASVGATTGADGTFSLSVPEASGTLVVSFIGYTSQEKPFTGPGTINIALSEDTKALQEVVVVGYGTQKKADVTGAVTQVSAKDFNSGINPNPLQAIQGKVAGLVITQPSGDPNGSPTIRLRGYTSLAGGSDPLYVVDGIIGVPINSISPNDIETMDVLKDASATAIYGSRAANGVIIITTKRGKAGTTSVTFNNYVGIEHISNRLDLLDGDQFRAEVTRVKGEASLSDNLKFPKDASGNGYSTDWFKEITRVAYTNNHNLAITGGGENFSYRGSLDYIKREGIIKKTGFDRMTGRVNLDQKALDGRLNVQYSLSYTQTDQENKSDDILNRAILYLPTLPIRNPDGSYYAIPGSFDLLNPVAMQNNYLNDELKRVLIGGLNVRYEVLNGLVLGVNGALRNENAVNSQAYNGDIPGLYGQGGASRALYQTNNKLLELTASYTKGFGETSNFNILGGYSYQDNVNDGFGAGNNDFVQGLYDIFGYNNLSQGRGTLINPSSGYTGSYRNRTTLVSFFGRTTFNLLNRYNITATLRQDGSSKFGANNKRALFPSFAAGWNISNESFLQGTTAVTNLKLRAGWGQTGNSEGIAPYQSLLLYGPQGTYYDGKVGDFLPGYGATQNRNPDLKWEVIQQANVGLDFTLFDRVTGTIDIYDKRTKDMLYNYNVSADGVTYFVNTITANVGEMSNKGIEVSLNTDIIRSGKFTWNTRLVGSAYKNRIESLKNDQFDVGIVRYNDFGGRGLSNVFASQLEAGRPLGEFYIPHFVGFSDKGEVLLEGDPEKNGGSTEPVTEYGKAKLKYSGTAQPRFTAAFINTFQYGNFDLNFQLRGVFGNKILNNTYSNVTIPGSVLESNQLTDVTGFPANYSTNQLSDLFLENASFVRLDNWQIGYNVPIGDSKIFKNARIYAGGNNLFVITKYKGVDPELEVKGDLRDNGRSQQLNSVGLDNRSIYPKTRSYQLGVNVTF